MQAMMKNHPRLATAVSSPRPVIGKFNSDTITVHTVEALCPRQYFRALFNPPKPALWVVVATLS